MLPQRLEMVAANTPKSIASDHSHQSHSRTHAKDRLRTHKQSYDELNKYLAAVESRAADACAGFQRTLRDTGGRPVLNPIPPTLQQEPAPFPANPTITVEPPRSHHRAHRYTSSLTFHQVLSLQPPSTR